ncbi:MAG: hypothetical protein KKD33_06125, partial [Verrucomicrobia bacterium]|nr:hypothetical protein [Verrucomicrobiota bacterium]
MKTMMFYLPENRRIGNRRALNEGVRDIARHGFESILLQIRDTAFQMDDPPVIRSVELVTREAHRLGLKLVLGFVTTNCRPWSTSFFKRHPEEGDFYARRAEGEIRAGRLTASTPCAGSINSDDIVRVAAAFRSTTRGIVRLRSFAATFTAERQTWLDDTTDWHCAPENTVRVTGTVRGQADGPVVLYVTFRVSEPDYESPRVSRYLDRLLEKYRHIPLDGVAWDEPGFHGVSSVGGWNRYKVSVPFLRRFQKENGYDLCDRLPWLDEDQGAESRRVRHDYFRSLNQALFDAQSRFVAKSRRLFGK